MKIKHKTTYAIIFKHLRGWTYVGMHKTASEAVAYIRDHKTIYTSYQWKVVPCKVSFNLPDKIAENFL